MNKLLAALVLLMASFMVQALDFEVKEDGSAVIKLTVEEVVECNNGGGCVILTQKFIQDYIQAATTHMCGKEVSL